VTLWEARDVCDRLHGVALWEGSIPPTIAEALSSLDAGAVLGEGAGAAPAHGSTRRESSSPRRSSTGGGGPLGGASCGGYACHARLQLGLLKLALLAGVRVVSGGEVTTLREAADYDVLLLAAGAPPTTAHTPPLTASLSASLTNQPAGACGGSLTRASEPRGAPALALVATFEASARTPAAAQWLRAAQRVDWSLEDLDSAASHARAAFTVSEVRAMTCLGWTCLGLAWLGVPWLDLT
jgi:hypothetical protein